MAINNRISKMPAFFRNTSNVPAAIKEQSNPYETLVSVYLLRLVLGLRKQLRPQEINELFNDDIGVLTGLTELQDEVFDTINKRTYLNATKQKAKIRQRLKTLLASKMVVDAPLFINISRLSSELDLTDTEQEILVVRLLMALFPEFNQFVLDHCRRCTHSNMLHYLHSLTTRPIADIDKALQPDNRLAQLGWIKVSSPIGDLEDKLELNSGLADILSTEYRSSTALFDNFFTIAQPSTLKLADYGHLQADLATVIPYLQAALENQQAGVNILIYGKPGVGKTELAKLLAQTVQASLFEVCYAKTNGEVINGKKRFSACIITQKLVPKQQPSLILFDEAEDVFPTKLPFFLFEEDDDDSTSFGDKAWINHQLETNPVPMIWIVNQTKGIDAAYLRRFDYSLHLDKMPLSIRRRLVSKYTRGLNIDADWREQLAKHDSITPAQIAKASGIARASRGKTDAKPQQTMEQVLKASMKLLKQDRKLIKAKAWTAYDLAFTNTDCDIKQLLNGLKRNPAGSFCFYGAPGTGKSALAHYLAEQLELPIMLKRASDLLSPYVGQSEINIAAMFEAAEAQGGILLLDEADSLLSDRRDARQQWEITQVNEMLTQMETFSGIFICTTNLMDKLDAASLRRFSFKLQFNYLTPEQRWGLFLQETNRLGIELPRDIKGVEDTKNKIHKLTKLTPGDFAVIGRQIGLLGNVFEVDHIINRLTQECKSKGESTSQIGFVI